MRVLVVDDERAARHRLSIMLHELDVEVVGEAENGVVALNMARARRPDVVLLDISMPEVDGFDVAQHLPDPKPMVVFQTAHDEFALQAFDHQALDYLVKPVTLDKLKRALDRASERLTVPSEPQYTDSSLDALRQVVHGPSFRRTPRLLVRGAHGHHLVPFREVILFRAHEGTVQTLTSTGLHATDCTLTELEQRTAGTFARVNRSELVNLEHVRHIASNGDGSATLLLSNEDTVHVSRRRAAGVRQVLEA